MTMDTDFLTAVAKFGVLPAIALYGLSVFIPRAFSARTDVAEETARSTLIAGLSTRIDALEKAQAEHMQAFDAERQRRLDAESKVAALTARVAQLETQLRNLGHDPK